MQVTLKIVNQPINSTRCALVDSDGNEIAYTDPPRPRDFDSRARDDGRALAAKLGHTVVPTTRGDVLGGTVRVRHPDLVPRWTPIK